MGQDQASSTSARVDIPDSRKNFSIAIVGGGIAGLVLAVGLLKQGVTIHVYEAATAFSEIGAGIVFGPNVLRACELLEPLVLEGLKRGATCNASPERQRTFLSYVYGQDPPNANGKKCGDLIAHAEYDIGNDVSSLPARIGVHRAFFLDQLVRLIPPNVASFNKTLVNLEEDSRDDKACVILTFADGSTATADAVIGCDGIKSKVREIIYEGTVTPTYTGEYGYRSLIPRERAVAILGEDYALNGTIYCGQSASMITYPVEEHRLINMFAIHRNPAHQWPSNTFMTSSTREDMLSDFENDGWDPRLIKALNEFPNYDRWGLYDVIHDEKYYRGRVALLGDSAHAATPSLGAGCGMAIEDAFIMSHLIGEIDDAAMLQRAFEAYDAVRRPRTQGIVKASRRAGLEHQFLLDGIGDDFEKLKIDLQERFKWIWEVDLEAMLEQAKELVRRP